MKHADDDVNERLRNALSHKFDTANDQPAEELANIILNSIKRKNPYIFPAFLPVLIISFFLVTIPTGDNGFLTNNSSVQHEIRKKESYSLKTTGDVNKNNQEKKTLVWKKYSGINNDTILNSTNGLKINITPEEIPANGKLSNTENLGKPLTDDSKLGSIANNRSNDASNIADKRIRFGSESTAELLPGYESNLKNMIDSSSVSPKNKTDRYLHLVLLNNKPYVDFKADHKLEIEKIPKKEVGTIASKDQSEPCGLIIGFLPMNTFQIVRIKPMQSNQYQNFDFPSNFSSKKIAYKFQVGIEKRGIQLLANYSHVRQRYSYEIATDEYVLDNAGKQFNITREGIRQEHSNTLHLIGVGLKKKLTVRHGALRTYFINTGLDFSRELTSKQNVIWGTAGFGKEVAFNRSMSLMIGPYVEYSFSKLVNSRTTFQVKPYQLGISFNFKFQKGDNVRKSD